MSGSGGVDFTNVMIRGGNMAHLPSTLLPPMNAASLNSGPVNSPMYTAWETRESSPMSITESHQAKESMERTLNFSTSPHDDEYGYGKKKTAPRDPMSHRIIEKRRRDRMNNCLADLSRLIPSSYLRKGRGRIEKTEIIEMAIKHIRYLQSKLPSRFQTEDHMSPSDSPPPDNKEPNTSFHTSRSYAEGYKDCFVELLQFLIDVEGFFVGEGLCSRLLNHTQNAMDRMGHDIDLREHLPQDILQPLNKSRRDSSIESEARSTLRNSRLPQKEPAPKIQGHRPRALSQSDIRGIRITSDYDSEAEMHASGGSSSPNSSGNASGHQNQLAPENLTSAASSQLREMLQSPFNTWNKYRPNGQIPESDNHLSPRRASDQGAERAQERTSSPSSTGTKDTDATVTPYSFKRTIKERFKEELRRTSDPEIKIEEAPSLMGKRRPDSRSSGSNESIDGAGSFDSFPTEFIATAHKRRASGSPAVLSAATVPIFALHSSGAYYVPSSISTSLIEFEVAESAKAGGPSICHPVTINVNFSMQATTHAHSTGSSTPSLLAPPFPRPMFLTAPFLQGQQGMPPFIPGTVGSLPFVCSVPGTVQNSTVVQSATSGGNMTMRRGSLPVNPASHREPVLQPIQYLFPTSPGSIPMSALQIPMQIPPLQGQQQSPGGPPGTVAPRTSPHALNLSQPHTRL